MSVSEWREVRIGDIGDVVTGKTPSSKNPEYFGDEIPFVTPTDYKNYHKNIYSSERYLSQAGKEVLGNKLLPINSVIVTCIGSDMGKVAINKVECITNQQINSIILKRDLADSDFIYYTLISMQEYLKMLARGGTTMPIVNKSTFEEIKLLLPPFPEQKAIAATLSALDDMIELNNQINKTLEEMAQAIFKSWFVDFEPFKDGEFENSELGLIPKGWRVGMLGDFVEIVDNRGKTPPLSDVKTEYPIIDVRALSGESRVIDYSNCTKYVEKEIYDSWFRSGHPKHLDILISTVGSIAEMKMFYGNKGCIAQNVVAFRSNGISPCYLYQYLQYSKGDLLSYNIGSVQPSIKVTHVIKYKIIVPDEKTMSSFDMLMESISDQIHRNANESQILIAIRDTLLPKLISGEIRVPVEEVV